MVEFDELRQLWQKQAQPETAMALDGRAMTEVMRRFHRRQTVINCVRAASLVFMAIWVPLKSNMALHVIVGIALIAIGATIYLTDDWRNQLGIARLDFTKPSADFVESSLQRLNDMRYPFRRTFWTFMITLVVGFNVLWWSPAHHNSLFRTVVAHSNATAFPFLAYWLGARIREKRFDMECRPIVEKLLSMKQALAERSV
jgi:hypothetical protein